jgi:hypothetical protein
MSTTIISRAADIPLDRVARVSTAGPGKYHLYLDDPNGKSILVTRQAYSRAQQIARLSQDDDIRDAVVTDIEEE